MRMRIRASNGKDLHDPSATGLRACLLGLIGRPQGAPREDPQASRGEVLPADKPCDAALGQKPLPPLVRVQARLYH